jgi:hypothetical protein
MIWPDEACWKVDPDTPGSPSGTDATIDDQLRLRGECAFIPLEVAQRRRYRRAHLVIRLGQLSVNANT